MIQAKVVAHSRNTFDNEIMTMVVTMPRFILAEFNTHRVFSRNSASSRAIPFDKMVKSVQENPFIPMAWQKDHKGMQGTEYFTEDLYINTQRGNWLRGRDEAVKTAIYMSKSGVTKQLCNRLLEPFMWHTVIVTATEWENFFALRCPQYETSEGIYRSRKDELKAKDMLSNTALLNTYKDFLLDIEWLKCNKGQSEIHMMALAEAMWDAYNESTPKQLKAGEWHIPFSYKIDKVSIASPLNLTTYSKEVQEILVKISVAMAARTSYTVVEEKIKLSDFVLGFEYEIKENFSDGTVKTKEQFDSAKWIKKRHEKGDLPYIERMFDGENNKNDLLGLRHIQKKPNHENDIKLHDKLLKDGHMSPFEHCARAMDNYEYEHNIRGEQFSNLMFQHKDKGWSNNFKGFVQYRQILEK